MGPPKSHLAGGTEVTYFVKETYFYFTVFLRASVGFEIHDWKNCH